MTQLRLVAVCMLAVGLVGWTGCSKEEPETEEPVVTVEPQPEAPPAADQGAARRPGTSLLNAPSDYLRVVAIDAPRNAKITAAIASLKPQIQYFRVEEGRYPESLEELARARSLTMPELPKGYEFSYDPATGKLEVVQAP